MQLEFKQGTGISIEANAVDGSITVASTLEPSHFRGEFTTLTALEAVEGEAGDYAYLDLGEEEDVTTYIWDTSDEAWVEQKGLTTAETSDSIKTKYEANANTNAYTDTEKTKLGAIAAGAEVNQNAVSSIKVGEVTVTANGKTDTFTLAAGDGVTLSANADTKVITVTADTDAILDGAITSVKVGNVTLGV
jgi:hypothetical protein